jgi:hypothetical protein
MVQDLIPFINEVWNFYVRYPQKKRVEITGIVSKEFFVTGNAFQL